MIEIPALDERVYGATGRGAWHVMGSGAPARAHVSSCEKLGDGLLLTSELEGWAARNALEGLARLQDAAWFTRTWGDCYGYLLVATGRAAAMIDPVMGLWDAAALQPILEEAGGTFTDWRGEPTIYSGEGIGTNRRVLDQVLAVTRGHSKEGILYDSNR